MPSEQRSRTMRAVKDRDTKAELARHCVRRVLWPPGFPLVEALSSGDSAGACASLFAAITGRTASSDFFKPLS